MCSAQTERKGGLRGDPTGQDAKLVTDLDTQHRCSLPPHTYVHISGRLKFAPKFGSSRGHVQCSVAAEKLVEHQSRLRDHLSDYEQHTAALVKVANQIKAAKDDVRFVLFS